MKSLTLALIATLFVSANVQPVFAAPSDNNTPAAVTEAPVVKEHAVHFFNVRHQLAQKLYGSVENKSSLVVPTGGHSLNFTDTDNFIITQ
jgi:hypothetical protein